MKLRFRPLMVPPPPALPARGRQSRLPAPGSPWQHGLPRPWPQAPGLSAPPRAAVQLSGAATRRKGRLFVPPSGRGRGVCWTFRAGTWGRGGGREGGIGGGRGGVGGRGLRGGGEPLGRGQPSTPRPGRTQLQTPFCGATLFHHPRALGLCRRNCHLVIMRRERTAGCVKNVAPRVNRVCAVTSNFSFVK